MRAKLAPPVEIRKINDLLAFRQPDGRVIGFHARNMQVARLSEETWESLGPQAAAESEALQALKDWQGSTNLDLKKERRETGVRSLTVNVTQVCNLACQYCAAGGNGSYGDPVKRLAVQEALPAFESFLTKVPKGETFRITFLGGEPLLYPKGIQILGEESLRLAQALGVKVEFTLVTNGTLLTQANIDLLKRFKMRLTVSLDGPAEINDARRATKFRLGLTAEVEKGLQLLLSQREDIPGIMISGVFGRGNLDLVKAYEYYRKFDVDWFDFTYDHLESSKEINQEYITELLAVADLAFSEGGEKALRRIHAFDRLFNQLDEQQQTENYCGAGKSFLMMDARQNLYTCPWVVGEAQEVVGQGGKVWEERLESYQAPLIEKNGCGDCWARYLCGGGCMYVHRRISGDKHRVDTNYCDRTRLLITKALSYYELCRG